MPYMRHKKTSRCIEVPEKVCQSLLYLVDSNKAHE